MGKQSRQKRERREKPDHARDFKAAMDEVKEEDDFWQPKEGEPHYIPVMAALMARCQHKVKPGHFYQVLTYHDDWCEHFKGGICNCAPRCDMVECEGLVTGTDQAIVLIR